jgi:hypothetical protein
MPTIEFTERGATARGGPAASALARAADAARRAPSVLDGQPWRWRIGDDLAELRADRNRQPPADDPGGRMVMVSCGAALDHAVTALAGADTAVDRLPEPADPDLVARLRVTGFRPAQPAAVRRHQAIALRRTDRRPVADVEVPEPALRALRDSVDGYGAHLHVLRPADRLARWRPAEPYGCYAVLVADEDSAAGWLAAGEALSAVLLSATLARLAAVEVPARPVPRELVGGVGYPVLVLRLGVPGEG